MLFVDESHATIPQVRGMYFGDRSRKEILVKYGFRLPSALDNRPLNFAEFESRVNQAIYVSATPGPYELTKSAGVVVEQLVRPTGLTDPQIEVRPVAGQVDNLMEEIRRRAECNERVLVTTLTKRMAEDLAEYYTELGLRVRYLHSEIETLDRIKVLRSLRAGEFDALIGINLSAGRTGSSRGFARGDPGCGQRRIPSVHHLADSDHRARRPAHQRQGDSLRRCDHRLDACRDRGNQPPARGRSSATTRRTTLLRSPSSNPSIRIWSGSTKGIIMKCRP